MRSRLALFSAILFSLTLAGPPAALAESPMTKLRIEVKSMTGKPVERAAVVVKFDTRSVGKLGKKVRTNWELKTNQEGIATIPTIPQGSVLIQVIAKGYQTFGQRFEVREEEKTIEVNLNDPQPQYSAH